MQTGPVQNFAPSSSSKLQNTSKQPRRNWNTFVAPPPLFGQHLDSSRQYNWALK